MNTTRRTGTVAGAAALCALLSWGDRVAACSCAGPQRETLTLEIGSVTVDGVPVDLGAYAGLRLTVTAGYTANATVRDQRLAQGQRVYAAD